MGHESVVIEFDADPYYTGSAKFSYATAFLAETTIWMDILGSVSLQHAPKLHKYYIRSLGNDENADNPYGLFLSRIMGCENRVRLILSESRSSLGLF